MKLTDIAVRTAKATEKPIKLFDGRGLFLLVVPEGGKRWRLKYNFGGKEKLLALGTYPDVSLKNARDRRDEARALVAQGIDPAQVRKEEKQAAVEQAQEDARTFEVVGREWIDKQAKAWSEDHAERVLCRLEKHLFPVLGGKPLSQLRAPDILPTLRAVEAQGKAETASRLRQCCEGIFRYAVACGYTERNVGADLRGALASYRVTNRPAITEPKQVGALLRAIEGYGTFQVRCALQLLALTFVRPGELRKAEWAEIDLDHADGPRWVIPAEKMKMGADHIVPLSKQALAVLEELHALTGHQQWVFPSNRGRGRCMSDATCGAALRALGFDTRTEHCPHGFRSMASTLLNESGKWHPDWIERQLAHAPRSKVRAAYNRAEHLPERRRMVQWYADYLDILKAGGKVIPIRATEAG